MADPEHPELSPEALTPDEPMSVEDAPEHIKKTTHEVDTDDMFALGSE